MSVTPDEVERIAALARLRIDPAELRRFTTELNGILDHIADLATLDVSAVEPFTNAAEAVAPLRRDEPAADPLMVDPADIAPAWRDDFFTVPRLAAHTDADVAADAEARS
jgi:aspartyl-tRNA(Asn)/glutamyl-tRNA(Gln) amidotransferase subunit C